MTPAETQKVRDLTARIHLLTERVERLEQRNRELQQRIQHHRRLRKRTETMRQKAVDNARRLHARCIQHGIDT